MAIKMVKDAEGVIKSLSRDRNGLILKTNQIRKFLSAVNILANKVAVYKAENPGKNELSQPLLDEVKYLYIMLVYQIGRDNASNREDKRSVGEFVEKAQLRDWINKEIIDITSFENFNRYVEALVAYHKFYGGRES